MLRPLPDARLPPVEPYFGELFELRVGGHCAAGFGVGEPHAELHLRRLAVALGVGSSWSPQGPSRPTSPRPQSSGHAGFQSGPISARASARSGGQPGIRDGAGCSATARPACPMPWRSWGQPGCRVGEVRPGGRQALVEGRFGVVPDHAEPFQALDPQPGQSDRGVRRVRLLLGRAVEVPAVVGGFGSIRAWVGRWETMRWCGRCRPSRSGIWSMWQELWRWMPAMLPGLPQLSEVDCAAAGGMCGRGGVGCARRGSGCWADGPGRVSGACSCGACCGAGTRSRSAGPTARGGDSEVDCAALRVSGLGPLPARGDGGHGPRPPTGVRRSGA